MLGEVGVVDRAGFAEEVYVCAFSCPRGKRLTNSISGQPVTPRRTYVRSHTWNHAEQNMISRPTLIDKNVSYHHSSGLVTLLELITVSVSKRVAGLVTYNGYHECHKMGWWCHLDDCVL